MASSLFGVCNGSVMNGWLLGGVCLYWEVVPYKENNVLCKWGCGRLTKIVLVRLSCQGQAKWRFRTVSSSTNNYYCLKEEWGMVRPLYFKEFVIQCPFFALCQNHYQDTHFKRVVCLGLNCTWGHLYSYAVILSSTMSYYMQTLVSLETQRKVYGLRSSKPKSYSINQQHFF